MGCRHSLKRTRRTGLVGASMCGCLWPAEASGRSRGRPGGAGFPWRLRRAAPLDSRFLERLGRVGYLPRDRHFQGLFGLLQTDLRHSNEPVRFATSLTRSANPSNSRNRPSNRDVFRRQIKIELHDHQDHVGHLERREVRRLKPLAGIDRQPCRTRPAAGRRTAAAFPDRSRRRPASTRGEARRTGRRHGG